MIYLVVLIISAASALNDPFAVPPALSGPASIHLIKRAWRLRPRAGPWNLRQNSPSRPTSTLRPSTSAAGRPANSRRFTFLNIGKARSTSAAGKPAYSRRRFTFLNTFKARNARQQQPNAAGPSNPQNPPRSSGTLSPARTAEAGAAAGRNPNTGAASPGQAAQGGNVAGINTQGQVLRAPVNIPPAGGATVSCPATGSQQGTAAVSVPPAQQNFISMMGHDVSNEIAGRVHDGEYLSNLARTSRPASVWVWERKQSEDAAIKRVINGYPDSGLGFDARRDWNTIVGIDRPITEDGRTALQVAVDKRDVGAIEMLARLRANPNLTFGTEGKTALFRAVSNPPCNPNCIGALVAAGGNVDHADKYGGTPMHLAAISNQAKCIEALAAQGGNVNAQDTRNRTPLDMAILSGSTAAERELRRLRARRGADLAQENQL